ncbi:MAG: tetratricopeptide repeat protein, partial [Planctomycetes bacterium]|nr:tetratricopeptide repeat protein [Planctomycetota bacterium]
ATQLGPAGEIIPWAQQLAASNPDLTLAQLAPMNFYRDQGDYEQEVATLLAARPTASEDLMRQIDNLLVSAYINNNQTDQAIAKSRQLLMDDPENPSILNNLAYMLLEQGENIDEAAGYAEKAYDLNPDNPNIMDTYALVLVRKSNFDEAETMVRRAIQVLKGSGAPVNPDLYYHLGLALQGQNRTEQARTEWERALQMLAGDDLTPAQLTLRQEIEAALENIKQ